MKPEEKFLDGEKKGELIHNLDFFFYSNKYV
jgi:hypothetical protein